MEELMEDKVKDRALIVTAVDEVHGRGHDDLTREPSASFWAELVQRPDVNGVIVTQDDETWTATQCLDGGPPVLRSASQPWALPNVTGSLVECLRKSNAPIRFLPPTRNLPRKAGEGRGRRRGEEGRGERGAAIHNKHNSN